MNCTCTHGCSQCQENVTRQVFTCPNTERIIRHQHIVKHRHDTINEYDVIHEHEYHTRDVVREREVVRHHDCTDHQPNYCGEPTPDPCCQPRNTMPRGRNFFGRRW